MIKTLITLCCLLAGISVNAQKKEKKEKFDELYGMVTQDGMFYVDQMEVSIGDWLAFVTDMIQERGLDTDEAMELIPSQVSEQITPYLQHIRSGFESEGYGDNCVQYGTKLAPYYLCYPKGTDKEFMNRWYKIVSDIPVTGVSVQDAKEYALWYQGILDEMHPFLAEADEWELRLATPDEMKKLLKENTINASGDGELRTLSDSVNVKGCALFNYRRDTECEGTEDQMKKLGYWKGIVPNWSYFPSVNGLYNLFGNVAEMTSEEGVALGGSWKQYGKACSPQALFRYELPNDWVGFRLVAVVRRGE